jgi:1-acyl-sn-glycerol-3-phosphate acyltransferase
MVREMSKLLDKFMYWIGYLICKLYFMLIHRWKVKGKKHRPAGGPLIIMSNHISYFDPPIIGSAMNRQVYFMAKEELFNNPIFGWVLKKIGVFPIKRGKPDRKAIRKAFKILEENKVLGLFPEGTRHKSGDLGPAQSGSILLALKSKAPILPVAIKYKNDKFKKTQVSIGKPFTLNQYYNNKLDQKQKQEVGKIMMRKIKNELEKLN